MMLVMLMPSLACAMPACSESGQRQAQETKLPCHGNSAQDHHEKKKSHTGEARLLKDCAGVDLQTADDSGLKIIGFKKSAASVDMAALTPVFSAQVYARTMAIRGPPPDWPALSEAKPSILFTTQRFRV